MLSGLSSAQHDWKLANEDYTHRRGEGTGEVAAVAGVGEETEAEEEEVVGSGAAAAAFASWFVSPHLDELQVFDETDRIVPLHPVYAVPGKCVADIKAYFDAKQGF